VGALLQAASSIRPHSEATVVLKSEVDMVNLKSAAYMRTSREGNAL
jgi:hypothetical protein